MDFENVKSFLSKHVDNNGTSIYSHIAAITRQIVEEKPENAYDLFENISLKIKESTDLNKNNNNNNNNNDIQTVTINQNEREKIQNLINSLLILYGKKIENKKEEKEEEENEKEEENEEPIDSTKCANILENLDLLKSCGIVFDFEESYLLQNLFVKLIRKYTNIKTSRFWGKINGMNNDYWIVESKLTEYPELTEKEINESPNMESPGKGINEFCYFVTTNIENGDWTQLNYITPEQIKQSRQIFRLFTGDLNAPVGGRFRFEWTESVLLRSQIARITSSTTLAPNEYYKKPEEEEEEDNADNPFVIELNEEFKSVDNENIISFESWVHCRGLLRLEGRINKYIKPEQEENNEENDEENNNEEKEEKEATPEELEEETPILQNIINDKLNLENNKKENDEEEEEENNDESSNCWYIREIHQNLGINKIIAINNKLWNGAKTIYLSNTNRFINIYIGNGIKYINKYYAPSPPSLIQNQFEEFKEIQVPNPDINDNAEEEEEQEETITKKESIFSIIQKEQMPPPPPPKEEENKDENENVDADANADVDAANEENQEE